jgi:hypothetical protein
MISNNLDAIEQAIFGTIEEYEFTQYLSTTTPGFVLHATGQDSEIFEGPLLRIVDYTGDDSECHPLPRLLINFFNKFNQARRVLRGQNLILWANNRNIVVDIARRYIEKSAKTKGDIGECYCLHSNKDVITNIITKCVNCTELGPCLLCEYNTLSLAFLFRIEQTRIRAIQLVAQIARQRERDYSVPAIVTTIVDFLIGRSNICNNAQFITVTQIFFVQENSFAPEIRSFISRSLLITWASAVEENRLRPFRQHSRINGHIEGTTTHWPFGAYCLRAYPACSLDSDWVGSLVPHEDRIPHFLQDLSRDPYTFRPSPRTILDSRNRNCDWWVADNRPQSFGSTFIDYDDHWFGVVYNPATDSDEETPIVLHHPDLEQSNIEAILNNDGDN